MAINERVLENGRPSLVKLIHIMVHEACHNADSDSKLAAHDETFYRRFHVLTMMLSHQIEFLKQNIRLRTNYKNIASLTKLRFYKNWSAVCGC